MAEGIIAAAALVIILSLLQAGRFFVRVFAEVFGVVTRQGRRF